MPPCGCCAAVLRVQSGGGTQPMPEWVDIIKLLAAAFAGAVIGLERELHDKPAGFRTNIMICLGAALFTLLSVRLAEDAPGVDRTRIAAQIVTGVGFLGAGAIIQRRNHVVGLTTAATIWAVASVGMAFGAGHFVLGTLGTVLASAVLFGLGVTEKQIARWHTAATFEVELEPGASPRDTIERLVKEARVRRRSWTLIKTPEGLAGRLTAIGPAPRLEKLEHLMIRDAEIRAFKRL